MKPQLGFVYQYRCRRIGLHQQSRKADEAQRAVGELIGAERKIGNAALLPFQPYRIGIKFIGTQHERIKKRRHRSHHAFYPAQMLGVLLLEIIEEWSNVGPVAPQFSVVVQIGKAFHGRPVACIVEMVYFKLLKQRADIPCLTEMFVLNLRLGLIPVEHLAVPFAVAAPEISSFGLVNEKTVLGFFHVNDETVEVAVMLAEDVRYGHEGRVLLHGPAGREGLHDALDMLRRKLVLILAGAEVDLVYKKNREKVLQAALAEVKDNYDYILIDCPPSLGLLTINALAAADSVIIPIQSEYYALEGLSQLMNSITLVKQHLNPELEVDGVVLTMYDSRSLISKQIADEIRKFFTRRVFEIVVPRNIRLVEATSYGKPIVLHDPKCAGARAYKALTQEYLGKEKEKN